MDSQGESSSANAAPTNDTQNQDAPATLPTSTAPQYTIAPSVPRVIKKKAKGKKSKKDDDEQFRGLPGFEEEEESSDDDLTKVLKSLEDLKTKKLALDVFKMREFLGDLLNHTILRTAGIEEAVTRLYTLLVDPTSTIQAAAALQIQKLLDDTERTGTGGVEPEWSPVPPTEFRRSPAPEPETPVIDPAEIPLPPSVPSSPGSADLKEGSRFSAPIDKLKKLFLLHFNRSNVAPAALVILLLNNLLLFLLLLLVYRDISSFSGQKSAADSAWDSEFSHWIRGMGPRANVVISMNPEWGTMTAVPQPTGAGF
ncbi:hypothetical protein HYFRA_00002934 [Hymenoscyphus fraxineus]|uniref:Uncharacterized protein n=1 Tax=Hymenoscyphus fraxineus TaxID=746836 RepID=A0A9N9PPK0_9HELO|nr:hypothetical protein HYFRA_00002934 [Hymenoscyphus fraxineus]